MFVMMPVNVISRECSSCHRLKVCIVDEHGDREMECAHYDDCLAAVDIYRRGHCDQDCMNPINGPLKEEYK